MKVQYIQLHLSTTEAKLTARQAREKSLGGKTLTLLSSCPLVMPVALTSASSTNGCIGCRGVSLIEAAEQVLRSLNTAPECSLVGQNKQVLWCLSNLLDRNWTG